MRCVLGLLCLSLLGGCAEPMLHATSKVCVADTAGIGDRVWLIDLGSYGTITEILGRSRECRNDEIPVLAIAKGV